jgi:hypothetical protein
MLGEAFFGKSITGKDLSPGERVVLGIGALLAEVGPLIRVGRTAVAAARLSKVADVSAAPRQCACAGPRGH